MTETPAETPAESVPLTLEDVQQMIADQLAVRDAQHAEEMAELRASLTVKTDTSPVPAHSAGPGLTVAETWGQYEQGVAQAEAHAVATASAA